VFYVFPITTPANTLESAKQKTTLKLTSGRITQVQVQFPSGHIGLTHISLNVGLYQLYPANPEAQFSSSGETICFVEDITLASPPYEMEAYTWNEDDTYEHTITVRIHIEPATATRTLAEEVAALLAGQEVS
jgi:hypothetical protein